MQVSPYKYWTREELYQHLLLQCEEYGFDKEFLYLAVFDESWNPKFEYNGCNFVQDGIHPFYPCFIHDWRWLCFDYKKKWDEDFKDNLIKFGYSRTRASMYYIGVRCGWLFYYKWKK